METFQAGFCDIHPPPPPSFLEHFAFWLSKMFQAYLALLLHQYWNQPILQEAWLQLWRMVFRSQNLGNRCAQLYWGVVTLRPFQWTELGTIEVQKHIYTFRSIFILYLFISVYVSICLSSIWIYNHEFTQIPPIIIQHHNVYSSFLFFHLIVGNLVPTF